MNLINNIDTEFKDLQSRGFLVIRSFLSPAEVKILCDDYKRNDLADNQNYNLVEFSPEAFDKIRLKLEEVIVRVTGETDIVASTESQHCAYYWPNKPGNILTWHQDLESFFVTQNHYDYLNFYIPIQKPQREKSNLKVIPWDVLKEKSPNAFKKLVRSGANGFSMIDNQTIATCDRGITTVIPFNLDSIAYTPELDAGDLLLMRGDIIHRTQDKDTERVALTLRLNNPNTQVSRRKFLVGGKVKTKKMINNWPVYGPLIRAFQISRSKTLTWSQLQAVAKKINQEDPNFGKDRSNARGYLISQKIVSGSIIQSIWRTHFSKYIAKIYIRYLKNEHSWVKTFASYITK